jgi:hypothetical protein
MGMLIEEDRAKELFEMTKENNRMLKAMRRDAFIGGVIHFVWLILVFVVLPYFAWMWLQPYLDAAMGAYQQANQQSQEMASAIDQIKQAGSSFGGFDFGKLWEQFSGGGK